MAGTLNPERIFMDAVIKALDEGRFDDAKEASNVALRFLQGMRKTKGRRNKIKKLESILRALGDPCVDA